MTDLLMRFIIEKNHTTATNDGKEESTILQPMTTSKRIITLLSQHREKHHFPTGVTNLLSNSKNIKKHHFPIRSLIVSEERENSDRISTSWLTSDLKSRKDSKPIQDKY